MPLEAARVFFGPGSDRPFIIDVETGERRPPVVSDLERMARLCDGLGQMDFMMSLGVPCDVPPLDHYLHAFIAMFAARSSPLSTRRATAGTWN